MLQQRAQAEEYEAEQVEAIEDSLTGKSSDMECIAMACPDLLRRGKRLFKV